MITVTRQPDTRKPAGSRSELLCAPNEYAFLRDTSKESVNQRRGCVESYPNWIVKLTDPLVAPVHSYSI
jgi:hypothetical protein